MVPTLRRMILQDDADCSYGNGGRREVCFCLADWGFDPEVAVAVVTPCILEGCVVGSSHGDMENAFLFSGRRKGSRTCTVVCWVQSRCMIGTALEYRRGG